MPRQRRDLEQDSRDAESVAFHVLERLASIFLRLGLGAPRAEYLLRRALISEAAKSARRHGARATQSQIALLAGVNRLDVRRILENQYERTLGRKSKSETRIQRILTAWYQDPKFSNGRGRPKSLTFIGEENQFETLVRIYGRDITARTVRDDLTRKGLVSTKKGRLILNSRNVPVSARAAAALSDLSLLSEQLSHFEFETVRRTSITRALTLSASDAKLLKLVQRKSIAKLETALNSLEAFKPTAHLPKDPRSGLRHQLRIVTIISAETSRESTSKS